MNKQRASQIIEMAFLNADGHIMQKDELLYDAQEKVGVWNLYVEPNINPKK